MIYLIKSAELREDNSFGIILKIGYTEDMKSDKRFEAYTNHNPSYKILYTIPEATKEQEDKLHAYFYRFRKYGHEWYDYKEEILDYFKTHTTKEDLDSLLEDLKTLRKEDLPPRYRSIIYPRYTVKSEDQIILDYLETCTNQDYIDFLNRFLEYTRFMNRLELVCLELPGEDLLDILGLPGFYYKKIGPKKCKALKYCKESIISEYYRLICNQEINIRDEVFKTFIIGKWYSKIDIKTKLINLYSSCGYQDTAKAIDIEKFFNTQACQITNKETGKREHGFLILSRKED